jgi:hypothetical protein
MKMARRVHGLADTFAKHQFSARPLLPKPVMRVTFPTLDQQVLGSAAKT